MQCALSRDAYRRRRMGVDPDELGGYDQGSICEICPAGVERR